MIDDFHGKTAVITGAGSGIGLECARIAAARGMNLVLVDIEQHALDAAEAEARAAGVRTLARRIDVSRPPLVELLATHVAEEFGAPHLVLNNAGVATGGLIWEASVKDWEWVLGVNLWGVVNGVRCFAPPMLEAAAADPAWRGHIVNTASMAGLLAPPNMGVYNVSKHAVVALTESLHQDLRLVTTQVGASVLCPYFVPTGITRSARNRPAEPAAAPPTASQRAGQAMSEQAVGGGKVTVAEVARLVFEAVEQGRFYVFSHPGALGNVRARMQAIVEMREPPDPFAERPALGEQLRQALRGG